MTTSMARIDGKLSFSEYLKYHQIHDKMKLVYLKILENCIGRNETKNITVVDYGTSDGGNIIPTFNYFIEFLKTHFPEKEITFVFNDHRGNDFGPLIRHIKDNIDFQRYENVHTMVNVGNVYRRCLPSTSVDIAFCMFVLNYLSRRIPIVNGLFLSDCTETEYTEIRRQSLEDWKQFLQFRCSELKTVGVLIIILPFYKMYGNTSQDNIYHQLSCIYKQMLEEDIITQKEFERTFLPVFTEHTVEDIKAPFMDGVITSMEISDLQFKHLHFEDVCSSNADFVVWFKVAIFNTLKCGLDENREESEKNEICNLMFSRFNFLQPDIRSKLCVDYHEITIRKHAT